MCCALCFSEYQYISAHMQSYTRQPSIQCEFSYIQIFFFSHQPARVPKIQSLNFGAKKISDSLILKMRKKKKKKENSGVIYTISQQQNSNGTHTSKSSFSNFWIMYYLQKVSINTYTENQGSLNIITRYIQQSDQLFPASKGLEEMYMWKVEKILERLKTHENAIQIVSAHKGGILSMKQKKKETYRHWVIYTGRRKKKKENELSGKIFLYTLRTKDRINLGFSFIRSLSRVKT